MAARRTRSGSKAHREFLSEAEDILEQMREALADMSEQCTAEAESPPDLINRFFRSAHSLKGLAGMFGLEHMSELSHHLEDVLDGMRLGRVAIDPTSLGLVEETVELIGELMLGLASGEEAPDVSVAAGDLVSRIHSAIRTPVADRVELTSVDLDPALLRALTEYEEHRLRENIRRGRRVLLVEATFEILSFDEGLAELSNAVHEVGEVLSTLPSPGAAPESQIRFGLLVATDLTSDALATRLDFPRITVRTVYEPRATAVAESPSATAPSPDLRSEPPAEVELPVAPAGEASGLDASDLASLKSISDTVRVDIRKLDELMNLVGELVIQRSAIGAIARRLSADAATNRVGTELEKAHKSLDRKIQELQAGVLEVRMVPLRQVFEKLSRVVRRLRLDLGKDVNLELRGADTELDKLLVEELVDPLMHVVRNAFDHAIEPADVRIAAGKHPEGCIRVDAFQRGNHVVIQVSDDGRGIDLARVRQRAEELGFLSRNEVASRRELLDLLFRPGFSTRNEITQTSGRGVGMDVVKTNLTAMGGIVDLDTVEGRGTTTTMTLPITLAIIQALLVGVADQRYAIPLNSVLETMLVDPDEIQHSESREILDLRGEALTLRRLSHEFDLEDSPPDAKLYVVVIGLGDARIGLLVDSLEGQQDTVIKPVQGPIQNVHGISGATEIGDLGAVLVLDVAALIEGTLRRWEAA